MHAEVIETTFEQSLTEEPSLGSKADQPALLTGLPLVSFEDYQESRAHVFPSIDSLRWFDRLQKAELLAAGAICMPAGKKMIIPDLFDRVVIEVGRRLAATRTARR